MTYTAYTSSLLRSLGGRGDSVIFLLVLACSRFGDLTLLLLLPQIRGRLIVLIWKKLMLDDRAGALKSASVHVPWIKSSTQISPAYMCVSEGCFV
jgi:hypothetical protein